MGNAGDEDGARTALVVVDVIDTFDHPDGDRVLAAMRSRADGLERTIRIARDKGWQIVYVNDDHGAWDGDAPGLVRRALAGPGGDVVARVAPRDGDRFVLKPSYSAFDGTPLGILLDQTGVEEVVLVGAVTEMCIRESAIDASRRGLRTTVVSAGAVPIDPALGDLALQALDRLTGVDIVDELPDDEDPG